MNKQFIDTDKSINIFLVDDDALFLKSLEIDFLCHSESTGIDINIQLFATGELCIGKLSENPDVVILDYNLDSTEKGAMDGIKTLDGIKEFNAKLPVIMLSAQDKIDVAVDCMHHGAFDYVVKSETAFMRLKHCINAIFQHQKMADRLNWYQDRM